MARRLRRWCTRPTTPCAPSAAGARRLSAMRSCSATAKDAAVRCTSAACTLRWPPSPRAGGGAPCAWARAWAWRRRSGPRWRRRRPRAAARRRSSSAPTPQRPPSAGPCCTRQWSSCARPYHSWTGRTPPPPSSRQITSPSCSSGPRSSAPRRRHRAAQRWAQRAQAAVKARGLSVAWFASACSAPLSSSRRRLGVSPRSPSARSARRSSARAWGASSCAPPWRRCAPWAPCTCSPTRTTTQLASSRGKASASTTTRAWRPTATTGASRTSWARSSCRPRWR
mmetsp:Transcript_15674/g.42077  ORF Transcript_15674/g.42077 Transcript_15674/m.42077 type:complete len:282 (+) Transcript_15674:450-1295(+)